MNKWLKLLSAAIALTIAGCPIYESQERFEAKPVVKITCKDVFNSTANVQHNLFQDEIPEVQDFVNVVDCICQMEDPISLENGQLVFYSFPETKAACQLGEASNESFNVLGKEVLIANDKILAQRFVMCQELVSKCME